MSVFVRNSSAGGAEHGAPGGAAHGVGGARSNVRGRACWFCGALAVALALLLFSCGDVRQLTKITVFAPALEQNALLYVASAHRLFERNGVDVELKGVETGPAAIAAIAAGTAQIAETAEFPFVVAAMEGRALRILAVNDRFENDYLIARLDRGISQVSDLKGKRVGVALRTIPDFYLGRFLTLNGLSDEDVTKVDVGPDEFARAIDEGAVDALVAWQPYVNRITSSNPNEFKIWPVQSSQPVFGVLVCSASWLRDHADAAARFLRSLSGAEDYVLEHPAESREIVAHRLNESESYLSGVWREHEFALNLDLSLVAAMEGEARWLIQKRIVDATEVPNFLQLIDQTGLSAVRPESVNLSP